MTWLEYHYLKSTIELIKKHFNPYYKETISKIQNMGNGTGQFDSFTK